MLPPQRNAEREIEQLENPDHVLKESSCIVDVCQVEFSLNLDPNDKPVETFDDAAFSGIFDREKGGVWHVFMERFST
jgi:hypothetical protein